MRLLTLFYQPCATFQQILKTASSDSTHQTPLLRYATGCGFSSLLTHTCPDDFANPVQMGIFAKQDHQVTLLNDVLSTRNDLGFLRGTFSSLDRDKLHIQTVAECEFPE